MKFLIIQENGRHSISKHLRECNSLQRALLFHGAECDVWGLGHDNYNQLPLFNLYDVIINLENYDSGWVPNLAEFNYPIKLLWAIDSHVRGKQYYTDIFRLGKYYKILEATKVFLDNNSIWFPNCYDSDFLLPIKDIQKTKLIGFCGNFVNREPLLTYVKNHIPEFSVDINIRGYNMIKMLNSYKISFNKNIGADLNYRNFETLGCGTCLLTDKNDQYNDIGLKHGVHMYTYATGDEAIEIINYLKTNENQIHDIATNGYKHVVERHTFKARAKHLIQYIKTI